MKKDKDKTKEQLLAELAELRKKCKEQEDKLNASNQQLDAPNQQLQATKQQLTNIIDNSPIISAYHDRDLNMVWANKAYQEATGLSLEEKIENIKKEDINDRKELTQSATTRSRGF